MTSNDDYVLELLQEQDMVAQDELETAMQAASANGITIVDALINDHVVSELEILEVLASQFGMQVVTLEGLDIPVDVRNLISIESARRYKIVPLYKNEDTLTVALSDPLTFDTLDSLRYLLKCNVEGVVATRAEVKGALDRYYAVESDMDSMMNQITDGTVDVTIDYWFPPEENDGDAVTITLSRTVGGSTWDTATWDEASWDEQEVNVEQTWDMVGRGKLIGMRIQNATDDVRIEISYIVLKSILEGIK